ncbi:MAG: hypothetical protein ACPH9E_07160 [Hyphomonas sp.]
MSLFHPPAWFPPQLTFLWPVIWVQVLMLRAQIRAAYGRGVVYRWSVTPNLRVYLVRIDWMPGQKTEQAILKPYTYGSDRLAAACDGRMAVPAYTALVPCFPQAFRVRAPRMEAPASVAPAYLLPLPET